MSEFDPTLSKAYQERYAALDEWYLRAKRRVTSGYVADGRVLCSNSELCRTEFYNDFLRPYGLLHECAAVLDITPTSIHALTLMRRANEVEFSRGDLDILRALVPHIRRASHLHRRIVDLNAASGIEDWLLDKIGFGVVLLRQDGSVLLTNKLALKLCDGDGLRLTSRGLHASSSNEELRALLASMRNPTLICRSPGTVIARRRGGNPLIITAGPISVPRNSAETVIGVFIHDPERRPPDPSQLLSFAPETSRSSITMSSIKAPRPGRLLI
jgi:hypothetical protein